MIRPDPVISTTAMWDESCLDEWTGRRIDRSGVVTIREHMNRRKRRFSIVAFASLATFVIAVLLSAPFGGVLAILALPAFAGFFFCVIYAHTLAFRCPRCRGPWHVLVMQTGFSPFSIDHRIRYCPYCAADIDAKDGAKPAPKTADLLA
jgi:hypothetical protein